MTPKITSTLLLALLTQVSLSAAFQYDVVCDHGIAAAQCASTYGTYCSQHGVLQNQAPSGLDCTTNRSQEPHGGNYCYCKFHYVAVPKATAKFNPNEILQQRREVNERAAKAAPPLPTPTFDPNQILQWARDLKGRDIAASALVTPTFNPNQILQWARDLEERNTAVAPLATPTFDPNSILQWARDVNERADAVEDSLPLPTPTSSPNEILQWPRDTKDASADKNEVRNEGQHFEARRQLPTSALNIASSILASLSPVLGNPSRPTASSTHLATSTHLTTSTHSSTSAATVTPILPPKSGAAGRKVVGTVGMLGVVAVGFTVGL